MDKTEREVIVYGHYCPKCYPIKRGMVRLSKNVNVLHCEICGFSIDDRKMSVGKTCVQEITCNYLNLIKQLLLNTKADYVKYTRIKNGTGMKGKKRADRELKNIELWTGTSRILELLALLANMDTNCLRSRIHIETRNVGRYRWSYLFGQFRNV